MGVYYYLMAQLPYLMYEQKPPMSSGDFKELALKLLNKKDASFMKYLFLEHDTLPLSSDEENSADNKKPKAAQKADKSGCKFIDNWRSWENTLRLNLARYRSLKIYHDNSDTLDPPVIPADAYAAAALAVTQEGSPLDGEIILDKARWNAIDSLTGNDFFHHYNVYAYYLKLLLLERRQLFNVEKGFSEYKLLYNQIVESSHNKSPENSGRTGEIK